jgi:hypothetical protein
MALTNARDKFKLRLMARFGSFRDIERLWLRWFTLAGDLILLPAEEAAATQRAIIAEHKL